MTKLQKQTFLRLASQLSPENLSCDGELPRYRVRSKYARLMKEWKALEREVGRKVTEDEVWDWAVSHRSVFHF